MMRGDHTEPMMPRTLHEAASAPAALTAFLRGVERRGAVFAQLQVGDAATGDRALLPDMQGWRMLGEAARHAVRDLSIERMTQLARMREAVIQGRRLDPPTTAARAERREQGAGPARWRLPAMIAVGVACLLAFAGTFLPAFHPGIGGELPARIEVIPLPPGDAPEARFDAPSALLTHPDFELLASGDSLEPAARDPGFYAWLAAGAKVPGMEGEPEADPVPDAATDADRPTE